MKQFLSAAGGVAALAGAAAAGFFAAKKWYAPPRDLWQLTYDTAMPSLREEDGWYQVMDEQFTATKDFPEGDTKLNPKFWTTSPHGARSDHYWCDQMVEVKDGCAVIHSRRETDHNCPLCVDKKGVPAKRGVFLGGIETRKVVTAPDGGKTDELLFSQAFGYYEARVKVPTAPGLWSAFWIHGTHMGQLGNGGRDGSEIDIYESAFCKHPTRTGSCIHYDGYSKKYHRFHDHIADTGVNLYDGQFHVYALKWTPWEYVFYVDGNAVWATDFGGISDVPEFLLLTVEMRENGWGPYGQRIGTFKNRNDGSTDFLIDYVKVYQNRNYEPHIRSVEDYSPKAYE